MRKIYCAGPLFNGKEKEEMQEIADNLEQSDFAVFLPHRDGFEFAGLSQTFSELGVPLTEANALLNKAIFTLDVFQVLDSDGLVLNVNGRVPDEGAMVEAGIAWSAGKKVVIYKNDARTLINGSDNPLLLGLADFRIVDNVSSIASVFRGLLPDAVNAAKPVLDDSRVRDLYDKGSRIFSIAGNTCEKKEICHKIMEILGA